MGRNDNVSHTFNLRDCIVTTYECEQKHSNIAAVDNI